MFLNTQILLRMYSLYYLDIRIYRENACQAEVDILANFDGKPLCD